MFGRRSEPLVYLGSFGTSERWLGKGGVQAHERRLAPDQAFATVRVAVEWGKVDLKQVWGLLGPAAFILPGGRSRHEQLSSLRASLLRGELCVIEREREFARLSHEFPREAEAPAWGGDHVGLGVGEGLEEEAPEPRRSRMVTIAEIGRPCLEQERVVLLPDLSLGEEPSSEGQGLEHQPGRVQAPALVAIEVALRWARRHPGASIFVAGHTDPSGSTQLNQRLSKARAHNVHLYLASERDAWAAHCLEHATVCDQQRVLAWVARRFPELECDPGGVDGVMGPRTRAALADFRDRYAELHDAQFPAGQEFSQADWRAFFSLYDRALDAALGDELELKQVRTQLRLSDPPARGFAERFRSEHPNRDQHDEARDRRVELVFVDDEDLCLLEDPSGKALYESVEVVRQYIGLEHVAEVAALEVRFSEADGPGVGGLAVSVESAQGSRREATTDGVGEVHLEKVRRGSHELCIVSTEQVEWSADTPAEGASKEEQGTAELALDLQGHSSTKVEVETGASNWVILARPVLRFVVPDFLRFDHDSALLMPAPWTGGRHPLAGIVHALVALLDEPERWLLVVGHASAPGSAASNQELSEHRADLIRALAEGDADAWVEHARKRGSLRDVVAYLDYLGQRRGWSCAFTASVESASGEETPETRSSVEAFQADYNARFEGELAVDGVCGAKTLAAIFEVLHDELERWLNKLGTQPESLPLDRVVYAGHGATRAGREGAGEDAEAADRILDLILVEGVAQDEDVELEDIYESKVPRRLPYELPHEPDEWASGPFTIVSDLTPREPAEPEVYRLSSADGSVKVERVLPDDGVLGAGEFTLHFEALPTEQRYTLVVVAENGNESVIFDNLGYGELHGASPRRS